MLLEVNYDDKNISCIFLDTYESQCAPLVTYHRNAIIAILPVFRRECALLFVTDDDGAVAAAALENGIEPYSTAVIEVLCNIYIQSLVTLNKYMYDMCDGVPNVCVFRKMQMNIINGMYVCDNAFQPQAKCNIYYIRKFKRLHQNGQNMYWEIHILKSIELSVYMLVSICFIGNNNVNGVVVCLVYRYNNILCLDRISIS